jgi:hypothetical protein
MAGATNKDRRSGTVRHDQGPYLIAMMWQTMTS